MILFVPTLFAVGLTSSEPASWGARLDALVAGHPAMVHSTTLSTSAGGVPIRLITVSGAESPATPASLLLVAGADGRHRIGVETAIGLAERLAENPPEWLKKTTLHIVPCLNPDAFAYPAPAIDSGRLRLPGDADHDGRIAEDPAEDLNGDGLITMMRVRDPAPSTGLIATLCDDPDHPGLMKSPDAAKGERPMYAVLTEGIDNDGDGLYNEDGIGGSAGGGIDFDMQWPGQWPEFKDGSGRRPLQMPETLELARWCAGHPELAGVLVFGRHDTLVSIPEAGKMDPSGQLPLGIENDDKPVYELLSTRFKEITGINESPKVDLAGSFLSYAYSSLGVPALGTPVWVRSDLVKPEKRTQAKPEVVAPADPAAPANPAAEAPATDKPTPSGLPPAPKAEPKPEVKPEASPTPEVKVESETRPGGRGRNRGGVGGVGGGPRSGGGGGRPGAAPAPEAKTDDDKWLKYFDERVAAGGQPGFIPWAPFNHPQLGPVEIGGFIPGAKLNPPEGELPALIAQQAEFLADLASKLPVIEHKAWATRLAPGLWRVDLRLTNTGRLPTHLAIEAKAHRVLPTIAKLGVELTALEAGRKIQKVEAIAGNGGTFDATWTVHAADGSTLHIALTDPQIAPRDIEVQLIQPTPPTVTKPAPPETKP